MPGRNTWANCRRLVQEQVLHDEDVERSERVFDVMDVGVGLRNVFAMDEHAAVRTIDCGIEHVGNAEARLVVELAIPLLLVDLARFLIGDMPIARILVRGRAHVGGALHVILAAQRVYADAFAADIAGCHSEVGQRHDRRRALGMFGDAKAVVDRSIAAGRVKARGLANQLSRDAGDRLDGLRRMLRPLDELFPTEEIGRLAAAFDELAVDKVLGRNDMTRWRSAIATLVEGFSCRW